MPTFTPTPRPLPPFSPAAAPVNDDDGQPLDLVFIEGLRVDTVIGIHASELHTAQPLVIDVCAGLPRVAACTTDHIADTLDYSVLRQRLHRLVAEHGVQLLEALAEAVATIVLAEFGACWVRIKVVKPHKFDDVQAVGVQIERRAAPRPAASHALTPAAAPSSPHAPERCARSAGTVLQLIASGMVPGER